MSGQLELNRLSLNQITTEQWNLEEAIEGCVRHEVPSISVWRHKLQEFGLKETKSMIQSAGLHVSSLCRGGMFPALHQAERKERIEENKRAIEEAAELNADVLVLVCGPAPDKDIAQGRNWVKEGIEEILPYAEEHGVKLGIEPLHPMYAADRSVITSMEEANSLIETLQHPALGVVADVFHIWWDPLVYQQIERASGKILGFHVSDWSVPLPDVFKARTMMGDGVIELKKLRQAVEQAGYHGPIEVEIINQAIWDSNPDEVMQTLKERFIQYC
ncbi:sugar phosphate isomerase/epimerase family protein [Salsuginibacillus kocurii]|uniref:sugar phosphate isomerase/epimerase family protein n=1 Tax=Salsuginibacillus kocurii TaxID=427078 RepID=UPI000377B067|nr:sugar phosphate isomerase/epimerase family protein [Salsuginibacillus kocurii]